MATATKPLTKAQRQAKAADVAARATATKAQDKAERYARSHRPTGKPATGTRVGGATPAATPAAPVAPPAPDFGDYTDEINAAARQKFTPAHTAVTEGHEQIAGHQRAIDQVFERYKANLDAAKAGNAATVGAAQARTGQELGDAQASMTQAVQQFNSQDQARAAALGRSNNLAGQSGGEALAAVQGQGQSDLMAQQAALAAGGASSGSALDRLGLIGVLEASQAHSKSSAQDVGLTKQDKQLALDEGDFKTGLFGDLKAADERTQLARETLGVKDANEDADRNAKVKIAGLNASVKLEGLKLQEVLAGRDIASKEQIAQMTTSERSAYHSAQIKLGGQRNSIAQFAAETARYKAKHPDAGIKPGEVMLTPPKGPPVKLTAKEARDWTARHTTLDSAINAVRKNRTKQSRGDLIKGLVKNYHVDAKVASAAIDFVKNGNYVGPKGYATLSQYFPGGVIPGGYWSRAPRGVKLKIVG